MKFDDIIISQIFIENWEQAPLVVRESVDRKINQLALEHTFRPSANLHRVNWCDDDLWIMHLNNGAGAWRIILKVVEEKLYMIELLSHAAMMKKYAENKF
jgi:hypothetical protein